MQVLMIITIAAIFVVGCNEGGRIYDVVDEPVTSSGKKAGKIDVCHYDEEGNILKINVSENALQAHLAHGDEIAGGNVLDYDCNPISEAQPTRWDVNGNYYEKVVVSESMTWEEAKLAAENRLFLGVAGHLAVITSAEENVFVAGLLPNDQDIWLGGYQLPGSVEPGGGWAWITGEPWVYETWCSLNNHGGNEDFIVLWNAFHSTCGNKWNDLANDNARPGYVAEWEGSSLP